MTALARPAAEALRVQANWHRGLPAAARRLAADWIDNPTLAPVECYAAARSLHLAERVVDSYGPRRTVLINGARELLARELAA
jgi:hypothetical protein